MRMYLRTGVALLAVGLMTAQSSARAQTASQPPPDASQPSSGAPASGTDDAPPDANKTRKDAGKNARKDKSKANPSTPGVFSDPGQTSDQKSPPASQEASPAKASPAGDNPFPEEISRKAAADANAAATPAAPTASDPSQGSSSHDGLDKLGLDDSSRRRLTVGSPDGSTDVYDPKRATEDVRVGRFYLQSGDLKGAYERFKEATLFDHEDAEAVFWLAEAARRLDRDQEAQENYLVYLDAVPDGPNAKAARKALSELASSRRP